MNKARMADLMEGTTYIPKTVTITQANPATEQVEQEIGFPCWIRASVGSGGLGSLNINSKRELDAWLFIHKEVPEFTVSEFLTGRHLANQMMYLNGKLIKNAGLHCAEYVMADIAPSKVTGNTSYGKFINEETLLAFCEEVMDFIQTKTQVPAHGVYSFDLKEDEKGNLKVTEINIRHMAYTGIMGQVGFDLVGDSVLFLTNKIDQIHSGRFYYQDAFIFLRDVDEQPIVLKESDIDYARFGN
jgi:predicted ATP-grasp superfamily ATP-dependent carboligase